MTPPSIWHEETIVKTYETDFLKRWKPACFFQAMTEAAAHHAAALGFDFPDMMARDMIWILSRMKIVFHRLPLLQEKVFIETWPKGIQQKLFFMRDFILTGQNGSLLAKASSAWLLVNPLARRLLMPASLYGAIPDNGGRYALQDPLDKINIPDGLPERLLVETRYSAIDLMLHTNNARYVEWICDSFSLEEWGERELAFLQVNYVNEVRPADKVSVCVGQKDGAGEDWYAAGVNQTSGVRAFEAAFRWK